MNAVKISDNPPKETFYGFASFNDQGRLCLKGGAGHPRNTLLPSAPNLVRHRWKLPLSIEPKCGGGLLLLRHITALSRRDVIAEIADAQSFV